MDPKVGMVPAIRAYWEARRDQEVRRAALEVEIELRHLEEERKLLEAEQVRVQAERERLGESEAGLRAHALLARRWGGLCVLALILTALGTWWSVSWYQTLGWEKVLFPISLCVLPLIGGTTFLMRARERSDHRVFQKLLCALGLVIVLSSLTTGALLASGRMAAVTLTEERQAASQIPEDLDAPAQQVGTAARVAKTKWLFAIATLGAAILLTVAGEIASAIAFEEYFRRSTIVRTVGPYYERAEELGKLLAENARRQEEVRRGPELLNIRLTIEGLSREEAATREAAEAEGRVQEKVRRAEEEARLAEGQERQRDSLTFLVKRAILVFGIALAFVLGAAAIVLAAEGGPVLSTVLLDLSRSTEPDEFARNLRAVEGILARVPASSRIVVLGITEASFGASPLLVAASPRVAGQFGEHLDGWRQGAIQRWRKIAGNLASSASGSDLFGALARAGREFDDMSGSAKRLIIFSDMRHVGRGFNFERVMGDPLFVIHDVGRQEFVPRLEAVKVWVLGAHTAGIDERQWDKLKRFWTEYFHRAGAELQGFSPGRRLTE
jgi:hypothetical protein